MCELRPGLWHWEASHPDWTPNERLPIGIEAFPGREYNDLVLWIESVGAVNPGDTLVDFGRGLEINEWLRGGVTRAHVVDDLRRLLALPIARASDARRPDGPSSARACA